MRERTRWLIVVIFAVALAWLESATVAYLRVLVSLAGWLSHRPCLVNEK